MIERICQQCEKHFFVYPSQISGKNGHKAAFCSTECRAKARIGTHQSEEASRKKSEALSRKVKTVCQWCGKEFLVKPCVLKIGSGKFCSRQCYGLFQQSQGWSWWLKGKTLSEKTKRKISLARLGTHASDETKREMSISRKGKVPYNAIKAAAIARTGVKLTEETKQKISEANHGKIRSDKCRQEKRQLMIQKWQNPDFVAKMIASWQRSPTEPERQLEAILKKYFPEFEYNGNGRLGITLGGLTPDFVNVNGKKNLIEVFGDYYHSPEVLGDRWQGSELGKIMIYNSLGYKCLIIWGSELKNTSEKEIAGKVGKFFGRRQQTCSV